MSDLPSCSAVKHRRDSHLQGHGIMPSISNQPAPDALPCKVYPMTQEEDKSLLKFLQEQEAKGYICPSISPYASPFFFIQKKDGKLRPVQDYRRINNITISNQYPLLLITDLLTDLSGAKIFTKLDIKDGYNNIRIKEGDEHKASIQNQIQDYGSRSSCFLD
jgi:hypothetical protein